MARTPQQFTAGRDDDGRRLERVLRKLFPEVPLSALNRALRKGDIRIAGKRVKADHRLRAGERVEIRAPFAREARPPESRSADGRSPGVSLEVLFRSEDLLAINKPAGIAVHGANSLTGQVRSLLADSRERSLSFRPGPLHRLDKLTTGVIVYGASLEGARRFSEAMRERRLTKLYIALLRGTLPLPVRWFDTLEQEGSSRSAELSVIPIIHLDGATLVACLPKTGRTHQIRKQAAQRGYPLVGDHAYKGDTAERRLSGGYLLHALSIAAGPEVDLGFGAILAPLPEESANRLGAWVAESERIDLALEAGGRTGDLALRLSRPVERLREEREAIPFLLSTIAAELHDQREALHDAV